ncbi:MAG: efflux RND transporter permease subunit, partial [Schleiferiaceae bacterium]|nr:efflux RND transporter permease subunit [Schleiferiaceae bacterium]
MIEKFSEFTVRGRWLIIIVVICLTSLFSYQLKFLQVDSNIVNALPKSDTVVQLFNEVGNRFGSNEIGMVLIEHEENIFLPEPLSHIKQIADTLSEMEGIVRVTSLTNMTNFNTEGDNLEVDDIIRKWPENEAEAKAIRDEIVNNKFVVGTLVSADGKAAIVLFNFQSASDIKATATAVREKIEELNLPEPIYFAGSTFLTGYVAEIIGTDMAKLLPIAILLLGFILYLSFRSTRGVILPILTAALAILWSIGTFVLFGFKLSMVSNNVPIIILAVGSAYAIHVVNRINQSLEKDARKAIVQSMQMISVPVALTALTTMVGFLSFVFGAYLSMIRDFGLLAALGTFYACLLALVFVPALLSLFSKNNQRSPEVDIRERKPPMYRFVLKPLYDLIVNHPKRIVWVWIVLLGLGIVGISKIKRSVSVSDYFKKSHPAYQADRLMEAKFGGSKPVFVVFKGDVQSPELLQGMKDFGGYLLKSEYVTSVQSIADVVTRLYRTLGGETDIPQEKAYVQQLWFMLGQQDLGQLITEDLD